MGWKRTASSTRAFLAEVDGKPALHAGIIDWFLTLPLWLDLPDVQVVHACWHERFMKCLTPHLHQDRYLTRDLMVAATDEPDEAEKDYATFSIFKGVECLTKGIGVPVTRRSPLPRQGRTNTQSGAATVVGRKRHLVPCRGDHVC